MSKKQNTETKRRGRPEKSINLPNASFVRADIPALNPHMHKQVVYQKLKKLLAENVIEETGFCMTTEKQGRPEYILRKVRKPKAKKAPKAAKKDLAKIPAVEVQPKVDAPAAEKTEPVTA